MNRAGFILLLVSMPGCVPLQALQNLDPSFQSQNTQLVPNSPFTTTSAKINAPNLASYTPSANRELALRVDSVSKKLLKANPEIGLKPTFATYGTPKSEIFHTGTKIVHITEGMVSKCRTEEELAAVISQELAEMVTEREILASPRMRNTEDSPPLGLTIGTAAQPQDVDIVRIAEMARYEKSRAKKAKNAASLPDPKALAERYLEKAGYTPGGLERVQPILREAEENYILEKQYKQVQGNNSWAPAK